MKIPSITLLLACAFLGASCSRSDETVVVPAAPAPTATPALAVEQQTAITTTDANKSVEQKQTESVSLTPVEATPESAEESAAIESHEADLALKEIELRKQAESAGPGATPVMKPAALESADSAPNKRKPTPVPTP